MGLLNRPPANAAYRKRKRDESHNRRVARLAKRSERERSEEREDTTREAEHGDATGTASTSPATSA